MRSQTICLFLLFGLPAGLAAPAFATGIERLEPPSWWTGFEHRELQLLVHGPGIGAAEVAVEYPGVSVDRIERTGNPNYLFVYLVIDAAAAAGSVDIRFTAGDERLVHRYPLRSRNADPDHVRAVTPADVIYLVTPDRFVNADPDNDIVQGYGDVLDRSDDYGRHGGDLAGIAAALDYVAGMGFTVLWLNPVLENAMPESSYHGYATTDFYRVDPRFGDNAQYRDLVEAAKARGLGVIMDMITNHIGSEHWWMADLPAADWLNFPEARTITSHARTTNQDPYASAFDRRAHADGWFSDRMPDLNQRNALLADYLVQNAIWWTEYLGLAGIRMDTHPYPDKHFMAEWARRLLLEYPDLLLTGEEWSANPAIVSYWQRGKVNHDGFVSPMPSMLDFPLQIAVHQSLTGTFPSWQSPWTPAYEMLGNDFLYPDPSRLVIFPDNHDMSRIFTQVDEDIDRYRMAIVYYATMRGIPQFYYGTEVLLSHPGTDSHGAIREEFPGGWPDHDRNAFTGAGLEPAERDAQAFMRKLLNWRKSSRVVHDGRLMHYTPVGDVYAYFRYDDEDTVMVILNLGREAVSLDTARFAERLGDSQHATDVLTGRRHTVAEAIPLAPRSVLVLEVD